MGYAVKSLLSLLLFWGSCSEEGKWWEVYEKVFGSEEMLEVLEMIVELEGEFSGLVERVKTD